MEDWKNAPWVDRTWDPLPVPEEPERLLVDFATKCNLRCPMCPVWGLEADKIEPLKGTMDLDAARKMLDQFATQPMVAPSIYGEPLLIPNLRGVLAAVKARGMSLSLNTNGLTLKPSMAEYWCELPVDSVMVSIDATTPETLQKVRSVNRLDKVENAVELLIGTRSEREYPRIGVSFTIQDDNRHEADAFVERWVGRVDVVRMGIVFANGTFPDMQEPPERTPCPVLYKTMPVHHDGSVRMCCLDGTRETDMGNVFEEGMKAVWHGEEFTKARFYHETGQWDKVPFCKTCNGWAQYEYTEEVKDGLLIRRSPEYTYYNLVGRLTNWTTRGGHHSAA